MTFQPCIVVTSQWHRIPYPPRPGAQCLCVWRYCLLLVNNPDRLHWLSLNLPGAAAVAAAAAAVAALAAAALALAAAALALTATALTLTAAAATISAALALAAAALALTATALAAAAAPAAATAPAALAAAALAAEDERRRFRTRARRGRLLVHPERAGPDAERNRGSSRRRPIGS